MYKISILFVRKAAVLSWLTPLHVMLYTQARCCVVRSGAQCSGFTNVFGGEVGFPSTFQRMRALDSAPYDVETWPGKRAYWLNEREQTDERNPHECPPSQTARACPNRSKHDSDDHLAFPMA
jgi:hypothetical protein